MLQLELATEWMVCKSTCAAEIVRATHKMLYETWTHLRACSSARDSPRPFPFDSADIDFEVGLFGRSSGTEPSRGDESIEEN